MTTTVVSTKIRRVRKEVRQLSASEWKKVVDAIWIMKLTDDAVGKKIYGDNFISYDRLVVRHGIASLDSRGDQAHFGPVFNTFHSCFLREAENSILSIDKSIIGLPYWDTSTKTSVFNKKFFGSLVGTGDDYTVTDGVFRNWPIATYDAISAPSNSIRVSNPYGLLRHPLNVNKSRYATRRGGNFCGAKMGMNANNNQNNWNLCLSAGEGNDINTYINCVNPNLHGPTHMMVAGTWRRPGQSNDYSDCAQWFSVIQVRSKPSCSAQENLNDDCSADSSKINIQGFAAGCFQCPQCEISDEIDNCMCNVERHCNSIYESLNNVASDFLVPSAHIQVLGDFADSVASVNDPIFLFFHCDMDRHFQHWLLQNFTSQQSLRSTNYLNFPTNGYDGTNLDDVINSNDPFINIFDTTKLSRSKREKLLARRNQLTHRDVLDLTSNSKIDYTYDSILLMKQQNLKRHYVRGLSINEIGDVSTASNLTTTVIETQHVRGFTTSRSLDSFSNRSDFHMVGTFVYVCVILVILLLCIPYLIYFFCVKYCYPRNDTIQTFEYTSNSCNGSIETKRDEKQNEEQQEEQDDEQDDEQDEKPQQIGDIKKDEKN